MLFYIALIGSHKLAICVSSRHHKEQLFLAAPAFTRAFLYRVFRPDRSNTPGVNGLNVPIS